MGTLRSGTHPICSINLLLHQEIAELCLVCTGIQAWPSIRSVPSWKNACCKASLARYQEHTKAREIHTPKPAWSSVRSALELGGCALQGKLGSLLGVHKDSHASTAPLFYPPKLWDCVFFWSATAQLLAFSLKLVKGQVLCLSLLVLGHVWLSLCFCPGHFNIPLFRLCHIQGMALLLRP